MSVEEFLNACELRLERAEAVLGDPIELQSQLLELEELLRTEWPDAIIKIKEAGGAPQFKEIIEMIFTRITKIETAATTGKSLFDGLEDFMQRSNDR